MGPLGIHSGGLKPARHFYPKMSFSWFLKFCSGNPVPESKKKIPIVKYLRAIIPQWLLTLNRGSGGIINRNGKPKLPVSQGKMISSTPVTNFHHLTITDKVRSAVTDTKAINRPSQTPLPCDSRTCSNQEPDLGLQTIPAPGWTYIENVFNLGVSYDNCLPGHMTMVSNHVKVTHAWGHLEAIELHDGYHGPD